MLRLACTFVLALLLSGLGACGGTVQVAGACPAVLPGWATPVTGQPVHFVNDYVQLSGRRILWNGVPIGQSQLVNYLRQARQMSPPPVLFFDPAGAADCAFAEQVRDQIDRAYPCRGASPICGQGSREQWRNAPYVQPEGAPPA